MRQAPLPADVASTPVASAGSIASSWRAAAPQLGAPRIFTCSMALSSSPAEAITPASATRLAAASVKSSFFSMPPREGADLLVPGCDAQRHFF